ncbi:MAG: hypothetical protein R2882_06520 [Gemmatimonadales bacterium]
MFRTIGAVLMAAALIGSPRLDAQDSPRQTAAAFLDAWNAQRWLDAARLLDLDQFDRFRRDFVERAGRQDEAPRMTVDDLRRRDPSMPREVAEYQIRMMEQQRSRYADPTPFEFARVRSAAALKTLPVGDAAAAWLESRDPRWQVTMQFQQAGCRVPDDVNEIDRSTRRLIGVITEDDANAYAVFREEWPGETAPPAWVGGDLNVLQLTSVRGRWLVVPRGDLLPEVGQVDVGDCRGPRN